MQLTETEAKAFWPVYDQYQDELFLVRVRTAKLIKDYGITPDRIEIVGRGWDEPVGTSDENRRVEIYWFTVE